MIHITLTPSASLAHTRNHGQNEFIVDITEPLRTMSGEGRIASNDVKIQLMPISVNPNVTAETTFTVGGVEVLRA